MGFEEATWVLQMGVGSHLFFPPPCFPRMTLLYLTTPPPRLTFPTVPFNSFLPLPTSTVLPLFFPSHPKSTHPPSRESGEPPPNAEKKFLFYSLLAPKAIFFNFFFFQFSSGRGSDLGQRKDSQNRTRKKKKLDWIRSCMRPFLGVPIAMGIRYLYYAARGAVEDGPDGMGLLCVRSKREYERQRERERVWQRHERILPPFPKKQIINIIALSRGRGARGRV